MTPLSQTHKFIKICDDTYKEIIALMNEQGVDAINVQEEIQNHGYDTLYKAYINWSGDIEQSQITNLKVQDGELWFKLNTLDVWDCDWKECYYQDILSAYDWIYNFLING